MGHTPQPGGIVFDVGYLVCVDTYCFGNGFLTAMNIDSGEIIQVDRKGFRRRAPAEIFLARLTAAWRRVKTRLMQRSAPGDDDPQSGKEREVVGPDGEGADADDPQESRPVDAGNEEIGRREVDD